MKKILLGFICFFLSIVLWEHYERAVKIDKEYDVDYQIEYSDELKLFFKEDYSLNKEHYYEYPGDPCWKYTLWYNHHKDYTEMYSDCSFDENMLEIYNYYFCHDLNIESDEILRCHICPAIHHIDYHLVNIYTKPTDQIFLREMIVVDIQVNSLESMQNILQQFPHFIGTIESDDKEYYFIQGQRCPKNFFNNYVYKNKKP